MLRTRIITAVILAAILLGAILWLPQSGWTLFTFAIALAAFWEWTRLAQFTKIATSVFLGATIFIGLGLLYLFLDKSDQTAQAARFVFIAAMIAATLFWTLIAPLWLKYGWRPKSAWVLAAIGWLVIFPTWLVVVEYRSQSPWMLLGLMMLVWIADTAAYFTGRAFGRHKLAPGISPGKTWEGVLGAMVGVAIYLTICLCLAPRFSEGRIDPTAAHWLIVIFTGLILVALSIVGDLFESWMKRGAGLKDSSNLLPGHGGVLDRLDALTSTLPVAPLILEFFL